MRRIWAFIVLVASVLLGVVFCGQPIADQMSYSSEFANGVELVYSLTRRDGGRSIDADSIGDKVMERLDKADIKNAHVEVVGEGEEAELRVSFANRSLAEIDLVNKQVRATGELTILVPTDEGDFYLTGDEFFDSSSPMKLTYVGSSAYPGFKIRSQSIAETFVRHFPESTGEEEESAVMVYIFQGFDAEAGDSYEAAFGDDADPDVRSKVIASIAWVGNYMEDELVLYTTSDENGNAFTVSGAQAYVDAYNAEDYGVDIEYLYQDSVTPTLGIQARNLTYIALLVLVVIVIGIWIALYGLSGISGSISLVAATAFLLYLFSALGFEFAPASIMAVVVSLILMVFNSVNTQEKIKAELKKGRSIAKATSEGFHKSIFVTIDTCLITFFVAMFCFILGTSSIKTFGGVLLIGSIVAFVINFLLNKVIMYFMSTSKIAKLGKGDLGLKITKNKLEGTKFLTGEKGKKKNNIGGIVGASLVVLSAIALLATGLTNGIFNNSAGYVDSGRVAIQVSSYDENYYEEEEDFLVFIEGKLAEGGYTDFEYEDYMFQRETLQDDDEIDYYQIYASFKISEELSQDESFNIAMIEVTEALQEEDDEASVLVDRAKVVNVNHDTRYLFLVLGLSIVFASIYILVRYGISAFLSFLASDSIVVLTSVGLFSALMLPYTPFVVYGLLAITAVLSFTVIAIFNRNRDNIKSYGKKISFDERVISMENAVSDSLPVVLTSGLIGVSGSILIIAITAGSNILSSYLIFAIGLIIGLAYFLYFLPSFYLFLRAHIKFREIDFSKIRKIFRRKKKPVKLNENEPHEAIVMGLNDFR